MSLPITYLESILKNNENLIYLELDGKTKVFTVDELAEAYTNLYNKTKKLLDVVKNGKQEEIDKSSKGQKKFQSESKVEGLQEKKVRRPGRKRLHNTEATD